MEVSTTPIVIIVIYLSLLLGMAMFAGKLFRGTSKDYFVASHSIGPFMLLMSVFGTTMTAFAAGANAINSTGVSEATPTKGPVVESVAIVRINASSKLRSNSVNTTETPAIDQQQAGEPSI